MIDFWILTCTLYWCMIYFLKSDWWGVPIVSFLLIDGERGGLCWLVLSWHWLLFTRCCQYLLNMKCLLYGLLFLQLSSSLDCFRPRSFEQRVGLVSMDFLYIMSTYYTKDIQQEWFRLSNWFSLRCLGPWMYHLPPVWWSNFMFMFLNESWCVSLT